MFDEAQEILSLLQNGNLPPLRSTPTSNTNTFKKDIEKSERGLINSNFGLQTITEGTVHSNDE